VTSHLDRVIADDLQALAADCRHDLATVEQSLGAYRDARAEAERRRDRLAGERRGELAALIESLSPVYAQRIARCALGSAALTTSASCFATFHDPAVVAEPSFTIPALLVLHAMVYFVALAIAPRYFARKLRRDHAPHGDVYAQLDQLRVSAASAAHAMVDRVAGWSVGLALGGVTALGMAIQYIADGEPAADPSLRVADITFGFETVTVASAVGLLIATLIGGAVHRAAAAGGLPAWSWRSSRRSTPRRCRSGASTCIPGRSSPRCSWRSPG
jgi:hypothetical protein